MMQACCDVAFDYAHQREQFGKKIGTFQVSIMIRLKNMPVLDHRSCRILMDL